MNLLDHNCVREFRPTVGTVIPGTHCFEEVPPRWSPPRLQIYEDERPGWVMEAVSTLLASPDVHVIAVSPAALTATPEIGSHSGNPTGVWSPLYAVTVIYQNRLPESAAA